MNKNEYIWKRRKLPFSEYQQQMKLSINERSNTKKTNIHTIKIKDSKGFVTKQTVELDEDFIDALHGSRKLSAYIAASDIRKFEIELFWKRATFFWAFIAAIYTAYFNVLIHIHNNEHGKCSLIILAVLGLFFCVSWLLTSIGSKHWQENWENHLDLLEDDITGPLYKTYKAGKGYSVTQITIAAGWIMSICAYGLLIYEFMEMLKQKYQDNYLFEILFTFIFSLAVLGLTFLYSKIVVSNSSDSGSINFDIKEYE